MNTTEHYTTSGYLSLAKTLILQFINVCIKTYQMNENMGGGVADKNILKALYIIVLEESVEQPR